MKKILLYISCFITIIFLSGCAMDNAPTKKVENFLNSYRTLDEKVINQMNSIISEDKLMNDIQRQDYKDVLKKQYQDLSYTVKDEIVDGNNATVTVEIEVYDFYKVTRLSDQYYQENIDKFANEDGTLNNSMYIDYRINKLKENTDKVQYTIDFTLRKIDDIWVMDEIDDATRQKIHGLYAY